MDGRIVEPVSAARMKSTNNVFMKLSILYDPTILLRGYSPYRADERAAQCGLEVIPNVSLTKPSLGEALL